MRIPTHTIVFLLGFPCISIQFQFHSSFTLSKPLVGEDGSIYACSGKDLYRFKTNGSLAWTLPLDYACNVRMAPIYGGRGKIYLVAENRVLKIDFLNEEMSRPSAKVIFEPQKGHGGEDEIVGTAVSTSSSSVLINIKNQGLFAYAPHGQLLWSTGPALSHFGYRMGCSKGIEDCYFSSSPLIDHCEGSLFISNNYGELYSVSLRGTYFNWVKDLSSHGQSFTITPGNNGRVYVTVPSKALILALDVSTGNVLWERGVGPANEETEPVVDSNGWISIGSLDGFLYSISPIGDLKKFAKASKLERVIQASPVLDCSGYAVYLSLTEMEGKVSRMRGDHAGVAASTIRPKGVVLTLMVPATGVIYWSERYPGKFSTLLSQSYLQHFVVEESIVLAFVTSSRIGTPLQCRSEDEKLASTCSQTSLQHLTTYSGSERVIMTLLLLETILLVVLAGLVRFCCIFWRKKKLRVEGLAKFLDKRLRLQQKKKAFDRTITDLQKKATETGLADEVIEDLRGVIRQRDGIRRKLSTSYSLGRDSVPRSDSFLPVYRTPNHPFHSADDESTTSSISPMDSSSTEAKSEAEEGESSQIVEDDSLTKQEKAAVASQSSAEPDISSRKKPLLTEPSTGCIRSRRNVSMRTVSSTY